MEKYITLAIHTYNFASELKQLLQRHDIPVELENVNISNPQTDCGVRVRIPQSYLAKALSLVEQPGCISPTAVEMELSGTQQKVLIPTDFTDDSYTACRVAFEIASRLKLHPVLLHIFATPYFDESLSITDTYTLDIRDAEMRKNLEAAAQREFKRFCARIDAAMDSGQIPKMKYSTMLNEGMPEEAILDFTRQSPPELVVMASRDSDKRVRELMGSVTAEVIDNCRVSVLTWPAGSPFAGLNALSRVVFFCNIDQHDLLAMDMMIRLFDSNPMDITLVPVLSKGSGREPGRLRSLLEYFRNNYPTCSFDSYLPDMSHFREQFVPWSEKEGIQMLAVPNKKKNIFARLFNPGLAHRVVFESDTPLLALPV